MDLSLEEMQEMEEEGLILSPSIPSQTESLTQTSEPPHPSHPPNPPSEPGPSRPSRRLSPVRVPAPRRQPRPLRSQERERSRSPTPPGARRSPPRDPRRSGKEDPQNTIIPIYIAKTLHVPRFSNTHLPLHNLCSIS